MSQNPESVILKGIILNYSTGEPIPYATVSVSQNAINTMSNESGQFIFKIPAGVKNDSIFISHVGFKPFTFIINLSDSGISTIKMREAVNQLSEVEIKTINGLDLLKKAIAKIPENYPNTPYFLNGFYRLTGYREKTIIDLSEAVFEIHKENYSNKNNQFKLVKSRVDKDLTAFNGSDNISIGMAPENVLNFDVVAGSDEINLLTEQGLKDHQFNFKGMVNYNGQEAYEISYDEKDGIKKSLYQGKILLDTGNLAFLEFDIRLSPKGIKYYEWAFLQKLMMSMTHIKLDILEDKLVLTYRKYGSKYYLYHVNSFSRYYVAGGKKHFLLDPLVNKFNYLVTGIDTSVAEAFQKKEVMGNRMSIESRGKAIHDTRDSPDRSDTSDLFWGNYNLIQPDFNVDSAVHVIQDNNATLNYKKILEKLLPKYKNEKVVRIDSILCFYHQKEQFNGEALIQYNGKLIYEKGFGLADRELNIPNASQTQFRIGSTSKQFTSMMIMQLVAENKLSVDDSVGKFLPWYVHGNITIQQLMTHQSGIPNYTEKQEYLVKIISKKYTPDELVSQFCSDSLEFKPGTQFNYSNSGYVILADIIEKLTGKKYSEALTEMIFLPLGMKNSFFVSGTGQTLAKGYINGEVENPYPVDNVAGAGGITSTAPDLLIWANALYSYKLLSKDKTDELFKPRVEWPEWDAYYGYGWMTDRYLFQVSKKHILQYHPGTEFGFYDMLALERDKGIVVILLSNSGDFPRFDMTDLILNELN